MTEPLQFGRIERRYRHLDGSGFVRFETRLSIAISDTMPDVVLHSDDGADMKRLLLRHQAERFNDRMFGDVPRNVAVAHSILEQFFASAPAMPPAMVLEALDMLARAHRELSEAIASNKAAILNPAHVAYYEGENEQNVSPNGN